MNQQEEELCQDTKQLYDDQIYSTDLVSIALFILYLPIGISLLVIRLVILIAVLPNVNPSGGLFKLLTKILGLIPTEQTSNVNDNEPVTFISNHVTCFDFILLKSQFQNLNLSEENLVYHKASFLNKFLHLGASQSKKHDDAARPYSVCVFPEIESTNGKYGLLDFNSQIFESLLANKQNDHRLVPVCLTADYCLLPFSVNPKSATTQLICTLFAPAVLYKIQVLDEIRLAGDVNTTSTTLAKQLQAKIAQQLKLKCTTITPADLNKPPSTNHETDYDLKKLVQQISEILPDIPTTVIQEHIRQAQSLDIDSLITGLLENVTQPPTPIVQQQPTPTKPKKLLTYAERKHTLIEEARNRYLTKQTSIKN